jgi:hypothetical protein
MRKNEMTVRLGHPVLIFIHSLALLLIGIAIGMHWQSRPAAVWIAISGAVLIVINEMISCFWWVSLTAWWIRKNKHAEVPMGMFDEQRQNEAGITVVRCSAARA